MPSVRKVITENHNIAVAEEVFDENETTINMECAKAWEKVVGSISNSMTMAMLSLIMIVAPSFSEERFFKMNALLFTAKGGKTKCFYAKVISSYFVAISFAMLVILLQLVISILFLGNRGLSVSIQQVNPFLYNRINHLEAVGTVLVKVIVLRLIDLLFTVSLTILASISLSKVLSTVVVSLIIYVMPAFLTIVKIPSTFLLITPIQHIYFQNVLNYPNEIYGSISIQYIYVIISVLFLLSLMVIVLAKKIYKSCDLI
jgi:hypothetical protein